MKHLIAAVLLLSCGPAWAIPVTWTIDSTDGTRLGLFTYDSITNTFSDIYVDMGWGIFTELNQYQDTSNEDNVQGAILTFAHPNYPGQDFGGGFGPHAVRLYLEDPLDSGILSIGIIPEYNYPNIGTVALSCILGQIDGYYSCGPLVTGSVNAVPIPAAVWLFGSALAGLGWVRRRQSA